MADPFNYADDEDADAEPYVAAFTRLPRRQRVAEKPQEAPVDPALLAWAKNEKTILGNAARERGDYIERPPPRPATDLNAWAANHKEIVAEHAAAREENSPRLVPSR